MAIVYNKCDWQTIERQAAARGRDTDKSAMAHFGSGRLSAGTTGGPLARIGAMDKGIRYDEFERLKRTHSDAKNGTPLYPHVGEAEAFNVAEHELLLSRKVSGDPDKNLKVLSCLNGAGVRQAEQFPDDPEAARLALKNTYRFAGVAVTQLDLSKAEPAQGLTATFAGLNTIMANRAIQAGDLIRADLPPLTLAELRDGFSTQRRGIPPYKFPVISAPVEPSTMARTFLTHLRKFREDPQRWRTAMSPELESTRQWESSVQKMGQSYKVASLLAINELLKAGVLQLGPTAIAADDEGGFADYDDYAGLDPEEKQSKSVEITGRLAEYLEVVKSRPNPLTRAGTKFWRELGDRITGSIFTDGSNPYYEFGFSVGEKSWDSQVRDLESGRIITTTPEGQLAVEQHNHFAKGLSAINAAILDDQSWIIGKCVRGSEKGHTVDIVIGACRP